MGCVSFTQRYFKDGKITPARYAQAYTSARLELMSIENSLRRLGWDEAVGASGTIRAICLAIQAGGHGNGEINPEGLAWLKRKMFKLGEVEKLDIDGIKPDRRPIFPAGMAILEALFDALELTRMTHSEGACARACSMTCWAATTTRTSANAPSAPSWNATTSIRNRPLASKPRRWNRWTRWPRPGT